MEIKFKRDTAFRKQFFVPDSFAHPAKMDAQLLIWLVEHYSSPGETILDPMAGSGTTMLACMLGRNCILVELEEKFCKMMTGYDCEGKAKTLGFRLLNLFRLSRFIKPAECGKKTYHKPHHIIGNWEQVKMRPQLGYSMGQCEIIQGDARNLEGLVYKIISSPPYAGEATGKYGGGIDWSKSNRPITKGRVSSVPSEYSQNPNNIGNLPYGNIDKCIFSPPYAESDVSQTHMTSDKRGDPNNPNYRPSWKRKIAEGYCDTKRPYGEIDKIITSPPYEASINKHQENFEFIRQSGGAKLAEQMRKQKPQEYSEMETAYSETSNNIGNLKSQSYLQAMLLVYKNCWGVLKSGGLLILVTKNFIRNKKVIRLDEDTIKLCEQAGFSFLERHYRKLPSQSFWRVIYHQKHPEVEQINHEDVLVFVKGNGSGFVDKVITSPPYAEAHDKEPGGLTKTNRKDLLAYSWLKEDNPNNIGNLRYGDIKEL